MAHEKGRRCREIIRGTSQEAFIFLMIMHVPDMAKARCNWKHSVMTGNCVLMQFKVRECPVLLVLFTEGCALLLVLID